MSDLPADCDPSPDWPPRYGHSVPGPGEFVFAVELADELGVADAAVLAVMDRLEAGAGMGKFRCVAADDIGLVVDTLMAAGLLPSPSVP